MPRGALLALNTTGSCRVLIADTVHPDYRKVVETGLSDLPAEMVVVKSENGRISRRRRQGRVEQRHRVPDRAVAELLRLVEDWKGLSRRVPGHEHGGHRPLNIAVFNPIASRC